MKTLTCELCSQPFEAKSPRKYCDSECLAKARKSAKRWTNPHARGIKGYRGDLHGIYFRSRWEANVARFLDVLLVCGEISSWEYEPRVFTFPVKRGIKSYTPDFLIHRNDGTHYWLEVKGWMDKPSQTKIKRFGIHYKTEELIICGDKDYRELEKAFLGIIPNWEPKPEKQQ